MKQIGDIGEEFVAQWLIEKGNHLLERSWSCRWGEIDLIAKDATAQTIIFVEVKTRSDRNWDECGLMAITPQKQQKLIKTASLFLSQRPHFEDCGCRFDVALVSYQKYTNKSQPQNFHNPAIAMGKPFIWKNRDRLILKNYLEAAFSLDDI